MRRAFLVGCGLALVWAAPALAADWPPVDRAALAETAPRVEKDADAEVLDWDVVIEDDLVAGEFLATHEHSLRIKIFTDRGRDQQSRVDIPFSRRTSIQAIRGRTILPDGTVLPLASKDVYERTIVKAGGTKVSAKSFVLPGVVPGAIIEYAWRETRYESLTFYERLEFQRDIPIRRVTYRLKPAPTLGLLPMRTQVFNGKPTDFVKDKAGYYRTSLTDVPAFRDEPDMPPELQVRPWMLVFYESFDTETGPKYWNDVGKEVFEAEEPRLRVTSEIREAAARLSAGARDTVEALGKLYEFCRTEIRNRAEDALDSTTAEQRAARAKDTKSAAETLRRKQGSSWEIDELFVALARASGCEARMVRVGNRSEFFFYPKLNNRYFLRSYDAAVHVGGKWRFYDPSGRYIPLGMLPWQEEGLSVLVPDRKASYFVETPMASPWASCETRSANLRLSADGSLDGEGRIEWTGHLAVREKEYNDDESPEARAKRVEEIVHAKLAEAKISEIQMEHVSDVVEPVACRFRLHVPGFAAPAGKRLLLRPAVFQHDLAPRYAASDRHHDVYYPYGWSEFDSVRIELPAGFELDQADAPASFRMGKFGTYTVDLGASRDGRALVYRREFEIHDVFLDRQDYPAVKEAFDRVHEHDQHTIALRPASAAAR